MVEETPFISPYQIESFHNTCDDKSHHGGGEQVITFLNGYATPLQCRSGIMYMSILGKPTDQDLDQYPHILLTSPHEWDPSVLDYSHPNTQAYHLGHLNLQLGINMTPGLMNVVISIIELSIPYQFYQIHLLFWSTSMIKTPLS